MFSTFHNKEVIYLKMTHIIFIIAVLLFSSVGCFVGGIIYADVTSNIPKNGNFEIDGYFSKIHKSDSTIFDGEYPYFTNGTGASEKEAANYRNHPDDYEEFVVELTVKNYSNYDINPVWAVSPGYRANYERVERKTENVDDDRKIWINAWLGEGAIMLPKGEVFKTNIRVIVKTAGMDDAVVQKLLMNMKINLQMGICEKSLNPGCDISRNITFNCPVLYRE